MARLELRDCTIRLKDGLSGGAAVNQPVTPPVQGDATLTIDNVLLNTTLTGKVPVGARFQIAGETSPQEHIVTERTQGTGVGVNEKQTATLTDCSTTFTLTFLGKTTEAIAFNAPATDVKNALVALDDGYGATEFDVTGDAGGPYVIEFKGALGQAPQAALVGAADTGSIAIVRTQYGELPAAMDVTVNITFTPPLGAGAYVDGAALTFQANQLEIKIGDGNLTYTEHKEYEYQLDRGNLDTVREGNQVPMDVRIECVYEHITTGTGENITPLDALKRKGKASEWVSSADDLCEPYAVDVEIEHNVPCGTNQDEVTLFPDFRHETAEINLKDATISITGKCNAIEPVVTRV